MADPKTQTACEENPKVGFGAYIALALAIIIFSEIGRASCRERV